MSQVVNFREAKQLTLDRLEQRKKEMPVSERSRPTYVVDMKSYSVIELINQVKRETEVGKRWVYQTIGSLGYIIQG